MTRPKLSYVINFCIWTVFRIPENALRNCLLLLQTKSIRWVFQAGRHLHLKSPGRCHAPAAGAGVRAVEGVKLSARQQPTFSQVLL